ncbi:MAG: hypothetical protein GY795_09315 [Desulfobacterales bacterium]|nr:hypothetical protein [Desulfobacterales bacterium]
MGQTFGGEKRRMENLCDHIKEDIKLIVLIILMATISLLTGCSPVRIQDNMSYNMNSENAVIIFSTTVKEIPYATDMKITFGRLQGAGRRSSYKATISSLIPTFDMPDHTNLHVKTIPHGKYKFYGWNIEGYMVNYWPTKFADYKFEVKPGKIYYLGNIYIDIDMADKRFKCKVINNKKRDLEYITSKNSDFPVKDVIDNILFDKAAFLKRIREIIIQNLEKKKK